MASENTVADIMNIHDFGYTEILDELGIKYIVQVTEEGLLKVVIPAQTVIDI